MNLYDVEITSLTGTEYLGAMFLYEDHVTAAAMEADMRWTDMFQEPCMVVAVEELNPMAEAWVRSNYPNWDGSTPLVHTVVGQTSVS